MKSLIHGKVPKGEPGYLASEKKRRLIITILLFASPLIIFFAAWIRFGTRETVWTVLVVVCCLPACRSMVNLIMLMRVPSPDPSRCERIRSHQGKLTMAYEMYLTFYEKNAFTEAAAVCGKTVVLFCPDKNTDAAYISSHVTEILQGNGYRVDVKTILQEKAFLERMDSMNENYASLEADAKARQDDRYPDMTRDEIVRALLLTMSL